MLIIGTNMLGVNDTKKYLSSRFQMKDLNEVDTILGVKVKRHSGGFALFQSHYIEKVLSKFSHLNSKEANTPYDVSSKLTENNGREVAQIEYASAIGSLMYAMHCTRLDIAYAVCKLSRFTSSPSVEHWKPIARVLGVLMLVGLLVQMTISQLLDGFLHWQVVLFHGHQRNKHV